MNFSHCLQAVVLLTIIAACPSQAQQSEDALSWIPGHDYNVIMNFKPKTLESSSIYQKLRPEYQYNDLLLKLIESEVASNHRMGADSVAIARHIDPGQTSNVAGIRTLAFVKCRPEREKLVENYSSGIFVKGFEEEKRNFFVWDELGSSQSLAILPHGYLQGNRADVENALQKKSGDVIADRFSRVFNSQATVCFAMDNFQHVYRDYIVQFLQLEEDWILLDIKAISFTIDINKNIHISMKYQFNRPEAVEILKSMFHKIYTQIKFFVDTQIEGKHQQVIYEILDSFQFSIEGSLLEISTTIEEDSLLFQKHLCDPAKRSLEALKKSTEVI